MFAAVLAAVLLAASPTPSPSPSPAPAGLREIGRTTGQGRASHLVGSAASASDGFVGSAQISARPLLRPGEVLETIPGVVISQHSGEGKANQYYLRGFNLDHGTDLAATIAGMPVNMPTHAHGQGYSDINWLIPELVSAVRFKKGPYAADEGDFSTAGAYELFYRTAIPSTASLQGGNFGEGRLLLTGSPRAGGGRLLYAIEGFHDDSSFDHPDNYRRFNGVLRYVTSRQDRDFETTAMAYTGRWSSSDQIPQRLVDSGAIGRFGLVDPSDGGLTHRNALATTLRLRHGTRTDEYGAYLVDYALDLFSNFTYAFDAQAAAPPFACDPASAACRVPAGALDFAHSDQRQQTDHRIVSGARVRRSWTTPAAETTVGLDVRNDNINRVALSLDDARVPYLPLSDDKVVQTAYSGFVSTTQHLAPRWRVTAGLRADVYRFDVRDRLVAPNSGRVGASIVSPKLGAAYQIDAHNELYLNWGEGFHSNDARGVTIVRDVTGAPNGRVTPLVRAYGSELGYRYSNGRLRSTFAVWQLGVASELTFSGDAGTTSPSRPSYRSGLELTNYWTPVRWLTLDADYATSSAKYAGDDPAAPIGTHVPGSIEAVASAGVAVDVPGAFGALRMRYFGPRTLIEDGSVRSNASTIYNLQLGVKAARGSRVTFDAMNLFNAKVSDIDYSYASTLRSDPYYTFPNYVGPCPAGRTCGAGVNDVHFHPAVRPTFRVTFSRLL